MLPYPTATTQHITSAGTLLPNEKSSQMNGLRYWASPLLEKHPTYGDPFRMKHIKDAGASIYKPGMQIDSEMGKVFRVGDAVNQGYFVVAHPFDHITLTAWIKGGNQGSTANVIRGDDTSGSRNWQFIVNGGTLRFILFYRAGGFTTLNGTTSTLNNDTWRHIAATYNGVNMRLYVDGVSDVAPGGSPGLVNNALFAGYIFGAVTAYYYVGLMGDARIYNRALSDGEIWDLYSPSTRWDLYTPSIEQTFPSSGAGSPYGPLAQVI